MFYDIDASAVIVISVILIGLLAGQMLAIAIANHAARSLPETGRALRFQEENKLSTKTMPASLLLPLFGLIGSAILKMSTQRGMFSAAVALELVVLVITMAIEVPINKQAASWKAGSPGWQFAIVGWSSTGPGRQWAHARLLAELLGLGFMRSRSRGKYVLA
jgi:hypothetical protein